MKTKTALFMGLLLAAAMVLPSGMAFANHTGDGQGHAMHQKGPHKMDRCGIMEKLNLTADQKAQLKAKHEARKENWQANKEQRKATMKAMTPEQRKAKHAEHFAKHKAEMKAILTPSQFSQFENLASNCKMQHKEKRAEMKQNRKAN